MPARVLQRRGPDWLIAAATAGAAVLVWRDLGVRPLWLDETFSAEAASAGVRAVVQMFRTSDGNMLLYHLLLCPWVRLFGDGEAAARAPSAICAVLTIPLVGRLGRRLIGPWPGALGAAVLAANPFFIGYGQEARAYTLEVLVVVAAMLCLERARSGGRTRDWAAWAVLAGLAPGIHLLAALPLAVHGAIVLCERGTDRRRMLAWSMPVVLLASPVVANAAVMGAGQIAWIPVPGWPLIGRVFRGIAGGREPAMWIVHGAAWIAGVALLARPGARGLRVVLAWAIGPMLATFVYSYLATPLFLPRYLLPSSPAWALLAGAGLGRLRLPLLGLLVWVVVVHPWHDPRTGPPWIEDWRAATLWLADAARPGDVAIPLAHFADVPFGYYRRHVAPQLDLPLFRATDARVTVGGPQPPPDPALVGRLAATHDRIWLMYTHTDLAGGAAGEEGLQGLLLPTHAQVGSGDFPGVRLRLYQRRPPGQPPP